MKKKVFFWCLFALCLAWTVFIFARSAKSAAESSAESGAVLGLVDRFFGGLGIAWRPSEHLVRKLGHFAEYFILGGLALPSAMLFLKKYAPPAALVYAALVALADEFLVQRLAEARGPSAKDVLVDLLGALAAVLLIKIFDRLFQKFKQSS